MARYVSSICAFHGRATAEDRAAENIEIRVQCMASLNGREPEYLIDPSVDLARIPRTIWHADWIMPMTKPTSHRELETSRKVDRFGQET